MFHLRGWEPKAAWPIIVGVGHVSEPTRKEEEARRKKLAMMLATATMMATMLASAGPASAVAIANGKGGEMANERAAFGIATAVVNTQKHDDCTICG